MRSRWDIFCNVIDNYGDIGVAWRLARQLVAEHGLQVRLWVDDLDAFAKICPIADPAPPRQQVRGVEICRWLPEWQETDPADVVIEAFGCRLPASYERAMAERAPAPLWLNLEYLSAEAWVTACHGLPSLQSNGVPKFFFFPGFTRSTGGVLREKGLVDRRRDFQSSARARAAWLDSHGMDTIDGSRLVSLFSYENGALGEWLEALAGGKPETHLLVPEGRILSSLSNWLGRPVHAGHQVRQGQLAIDVLPFMEQDDYDRLLWCCDFNVVRGEDSFLRAQWAGRPMIWHIYTQEQGAHWDKLDAFLDSYLADTSAGLADSIRRLWRAWNEEKGVADAWMALQAHWETCRKHAENWCAKCSAEPDLAARLVHFYTNWL